MYSFSEVILKAHAKLNLSLCVDGKIPDGFHRIRTLICPISLNDSIKLQVSVSDKSKIEISTDFTPELATNNIELSILNSPNNLAYRAAQCFLESIESKYLVKISLLKSIPTQAGLGGGSSDAAAVLLGLSKLIRNTDVVDPLLINLAADLGSDVVSLLFGKVMFLHGRGEKYCELNVHRSSDFLEYLKKLQLVLVKPSVGVDTAWAYKNLNRQQILKSNQDLPIAKFDSNDTFESMGVSIKQFPENFVSIPSNLKPWVNDFEPVIRKLVPEVDKAFNELYNLGANKVILAGSGSCVAGVFTDEIQVSTVICNLKNSLGDLWFIKECRFCA